MDEPIDVLMTMQFPEAQLEMLRAISPRLDLQVRKVNKVEDIPSDVWATVEVLYTTRVLPSPDLAPNLRWIQFHSAGIDHALGAPILKKPGIKITTMSGAAASQMAEYILMAILALGHRLPEIIDQQRQRVWAKDRWERFSPLELRGSTVGFVGYGSIARQAARLLNPFGAKVLATKRDVMHPEDRGYCLEGLGDPHGDFVHRLYPGEALRSMAKECDFLVVTAPLTSRTRNLVNEEALAAMKPTAFLVAVSRGGVVDQSALVEALRERKIAGAVLDVFAEEPLPADHPLWKLPNVIISPHISGNTTYYDERASVLFAENLRRYLAGERLTNLYDSQWEY